ncbi:site-specific DNA-methyltransferase [Candidatus Woesearchaeota archaeon]|nr:site-specific DNA-methyltransferase [Candidatus Woesearchaeota archaeon]
MQSVSLQMDKPIKYKDETWDFRTSFTKYSNHGFHTYPAMMIPQVAKRLIEMYGGDKSVILDPFMGSGTALLEATLHTNFKKSYGIDINPLALLISKVKTTPINPVKLDSAFQNLMKKINSIDDKSNISKPNFFNIEFWFKEDVITDLAVIKECINSIKDKDIRDFFLIAFSETVRNVSYTRNREFKLYRMNQKMMDDHNPNTIEEFHKKATKNIVQMKEYWSQYNDKCEINILAEDTRLKTSIPDNSVDLIVTSPPYGDSRTTVAYGQFSRLALQWLGYDKETVINIDKVSLGGKPTKDLLHDLNSPTLTKIINKISSIDPKRARDVLSFYIDFDLCVKELDRIMKKGSHLCFVVGNRTVKGVQIPTDEIIIELFKAQNSYDHINTFIRNIPHKRMPKLNSPTNKSGNHAVTMNEEWIVILEKN